MKGREVPGRYREEENRITGSQPDSRTSCLDGGMIIRSQKRKGHEEELLNTAPLPLSTCREATLDPIHAYRPHTSVPFKENKPWALQTASSGHRSRIKGPFSTLS